VVQALRLTPVGGGFTFNRVGLLAHPYMLGPNGDSNGCVSFKNYDVFLRALSSASRSSHNGLDVLASLGLSQASARRPISDVFGGWPVSCVELAQGRADVARDASLGRLLRWCSARRVINVAWSLFCNKGDFSVSRQSPC
jgi:hypothetical protein